MKVETIVQLPALQLCVEANMTCNASCFSSTVKVESDLKVPELPSTVDDNKKTRKEKGKPKRHLIEAEETVNKHDSTVSSGSSFIVSYMGMTVTCKSAWYHKSVFNAPFRKISNSAQCGRFALILWRLVNGSFFCVF